jgi:hypothetical protein
MTEQAFNDQLCKCGHLKSEHGSLLHKNGLPYIREEGAGSCCECECKQFRWKAFVNSREGHPVNG